MDYLQKEPIDVSVIMTTYGHELFIIDAIKGVINQDFVGHVELIISNDNSPDNTNKVVLEFLENAIIPDNLSVKYYLQESNLGAIENFLWCINESQGKFLAICEGDDYWTDTQKLSKQVSFLNKNRDFSIVFSNVNVQIENGEYNQKNELTPIDSNKEYNGEEIIESWVAHTSTFVIRNGKHIKDFVGFF
ncbi:glycosyltransferase family 2 protein [Sphingobacterium daejeonense]|uniref:glycosyltransferase family 2 protein n=1 Tax=Sphingobacterium daejeonense TaxID=371142 RepID=UPI0010C44F10|nr:glycosyltransferase family 2 protein [Sphingobacterium daejeonense]VTQ00025.1 putative glycosyl transferase [Sphingobacterium daejeonense]